MGRVIRAGLPVAEHGPVGVQDAHRLPLGTGQRPELIQQPRLAQCELAQSFVQVQRAARRTGAGGGIAFKDGDRVTVAVQDAGEGKACGAGSNHGDTMSHGNTLYFCEAVNRNCTMHA
jgi:hypothetical protein